METGRNYVAAIVNHPAVELIELGNPLQECSLG
jgi:hypothetical protein